tara:strand:+ start:213 stop:425 length:213 start_codon:yes stop_codon:yes gene_type:complete
MKNPIYFQYLSSSNKSYNPSIQKRAYQIIIQVIAVHYFGSVLKDMNGKTLLGKLLEMENGVLFVKTNINH